MSMSNLTRKDVKLVAEKGGGICNIIKFLQNADMLGEIIT